MLGMHGTPDANDTINDSDLVISLGARFDDRATGQVETFANKARIIHVDIDPAELNKNVHADLAICGDVKSFITQLLTCKTPRVKIPARQSQPESGPCQSIVKTFLKHLGDPADRNSFITVDVGQHQMWVAQHFPFLFARQFLSSSGLGTMGFGLPAAIGAQIAHPDKTVFNITGDGSFMMNLQELATVKRYRLPIKIVMFNNQHLGLVRQQQELFYGQRYCEVDLSDNPDFPELVKSFGFTSASISSVSETEEATQWLKKCPGPVFLEINIPENENVWPFVIPGQSNSNRLSEPNARNAV
jgi:acetolactate synthase-1/2/3 large subunit